MPISSTPKKFVDLPGGAKARVDANIVACVRIELNDKGAYVAIHTTEGFAFAAIPETDKSVDAFYEEVLNTIWPPKTGRTTK